jgi:hypothetical protein
MLIFASLMLAVVIINRDTIFLGNYGWLFRFGLACIMLALSATAIWCHWKWCWPIVGVSCVAAVVLVANFAPEQSSLVRLVGLSATAATLLWMVIAVAKGWKFFQGL